MIRIEHLHKYFNRKRPNEIHVINDTSLEFPEKGLVALTGPSGCGKTTLLNVLGGLDRFDSGTIDFNGHLIRSYRPAEWDVLRNESIGYIFQNYYLIEDKTVYENVEAALNLAGLFKKEEIEKRVHYVLKSVGMYNFRHRNVLALSGGQQQRVAIARAIVKNPQVVLADEPTGNLDANNTFEIMGIIKKISQTCLVILVSHERELVDFYADRVIEILDGKIVNDYENSGNRTLEHVDDRNIYLRDLSLEQMNGPAEIRFYSDHPGSVPRLTLVHRNNTLYIKADSDAKIKYLTDESEIRLLDEHYKKPETDDVTRYLFDLNQFGPIHRDTKRKSFVRLGDSLRKGFKKFLVSRKLVGRFFLFVCFVVAALVAFNIARAAAMTRDQAFLTAGRGFVEVQIKSGMDYAKVQELIDTTRLDSLVLANDNLNTVVFSYENYYQGSGSGAAQMTMYRFISQSLFPVPVAIGQADTSDFVVGGLPTNNREVAIDMWLAERILGEPAFQNLGILSVDDLMNVTLSGGTLLDGLQIVGVFRSESPVVVLTPENRFYFHSTPSMAAYGTMEGHLELTQGRLLQADNEVLASALSGYEINDWVTLENETFKVVGLFEGTQPNILVTNNTFERMKVENVLQQGIAWNDFNTQNPMSISFYSEDPEASVAELTALGYSAFGTYQHLKEANSVAVFEQMIYVYVGIAAVLVYIILMMRSSMLSRIKEIGIYRSIGTTKTDLYKIFFSEIFAFTCLGSMTGYLFMTYAMLFVQKQLSSLGNVFGANVSVFYFPFHYAAAGLIGIFLVNILFGMFPIFSLLRKTPAEINTKFDI
jgi:ABC-type lipoprotein export system ATPase subunit